jgi:hypothetical protein
VSADEDLRSFIAGVEGFAHLGPTEKIRLFAWLQHYLFKRERFSTGDVNWCYEALHFQPGNTSQYLKNMEKAGEVIKKGGEYRCEGKFRADYETKYGEHQITRSVRQMVKDLVSVIPELGEKDIFEEALTCLKYDAGRAAIIMVWNIAFYHLCKYILTHKRTEFNNRIPIKYAGKWKAANMPLIKVYDDFGDNMSEREVIEVANSAGIITGDMHKVYVEKLGKRNSAAHPSTTHVTQVQAEGFIDDLIQNTVLLLKI